MNTYVKLLIDNFMTYFRSRLVLKKYPVVVPVITASNLDKNKLHELILKEFTKKVLERLKKDLTNVYNELRISEQKMVPHTSEHRKLMADLHHVMEDLNKVQIELNSCISEVDASFDYIKKDLNLHGNYETKPLK